MPKKSSLEILGPLLRSEVEPDDLCWLALLNLGKTGAMLDSIVNRSVAHPKLFRFFIAKQVGKGFCQIRGWALLTLSKPMEIDIFVPKEYRRQGIGTALVNQVKDYYPKTILGFPEKREPGGFFESVGIELGDPLSWTPPEEH